MVVVNHPTRIVRRSSRPSPLGSACRVLLIVLLVGSLQALLFPRQSNAETMYYVDSVHGSDTNPGTTPELSWQTLRAVEARQFSPGDVINLRRGSVWDGGLSITSSGQEGQPIRYTAYGSGELPIIRNTNGGDWSVAVMIWGSWVIVEAIAVQRADDVGIAIDRGASHNIVQDCQVTEVGIGIDVLGEHNLVTRNLIERLHMVHCDPGDNDDYGAIAIDLGGSYNEVSYNRMLRCSASSDDYGTDGGAVEIYGNVVGSFIHHNWAQGNNGFVEVGGGEARDTVIAHNVALNNGLFACVHLGGTFGSQVSNLRVEHNTIVEQQANLAGAVIAFVNGDPSADTLILRNNVLYVTGSQMISNKPLFTHDHNLYYHTLDESYLGFDLGPDEKFADPLFADVAAGDFHLRAGSPAIDAAANLGYQRDWDGVPIPSGLAPDLGAYEFVAATPVATSTPFATPSATPGATSTPTPSSTSEVVSTPDPTATPDPTSTPGATLTPVETLTQAATPTRPHPYQVLLPMFLKQDF